MKPFSSVTGGEHVSETLASVYASTAKTLPRLRRGQLLQGRHPSAMCDAASGCQTQAEGETNFEVAQEEIDQRRGRKTLAENLPEVPSARARPEETLRLWPRALRYARLIEKCKNRRCRKIPGRNCARSRWLPVFLVDCLCHRYFR